MKNWYSTELKYFYSDYVNTKKNIGISVSILLILKT